MPDGDRTRRFRPDDLVHGERQGNLSPARVECQDVDHPPVGFAAGRKISAADFDMFDAGCEDFAAARFRSFPRSAGRAGVHSAYDKKRREGGHEGDTTSRVHGPKIAPTQRAVKIRLLTCLRLILS